MAKFIKEKITLPDYTKSKKWIELREKMGITVINPFEGPSYKKKTFKKSDPELTKGVGLKKEKDYDELINKIDSTLEDVTTGRKITVYIKEPSSYFQYGTAMNYLPKYHITNCQTLQGMRKAKRFDLRYVKTDRSDGLFPIIQPDTKKEIDADLKVCMHCLGHMKKIYPIDPIFKDSPDNFSITEYFSKYNETESSLLNQLPNTYSKDYTPKPRSKNWSQKSISYREKQNWTCEICNVCYKNNRRLLHTHHKDGNKSNDNENNLKALCQDCHNTQPGHIKWKTSKGQYESKNAKKTTVKALDISLIRKSYKKRELSTINAIKMGECQTVEFKASLMGEQNKKHVIAKSMTFNIFRTIASFLNTDGGKIIIGVNDSGKIKGVRELGKSFKNYDDLDLYMYNKWTEFFTDEIRLNCSWKLEEIDDKNVFVINIKKLEKAPVHIYKSKKEKVVIDGKERKVDIPIKGPETEVLIRHGAAKRVIDGISGLKYLKKRFPEYFNLYFA